MVFLRSGPLLGLKVLGLRTYGLLVSPFQALEGFGFWVSFSVYNFLLFRLFRVSGLGGLGFRGLGV